ncbi:hypothetical protein CEP52_017494 [Fusarium oligoseptatum]|uniref:Uncharacterized protein n=1 Tax=Fusarium oligoseptatum TaxID=2604345 RepID=A0A428RQ99_9HYPO|nr:hypothetical protein CEP52_017494 [Fusarium oligoseptatum]
MHSNAIVASPYRCCPLRAANKRQYVTACIEKELDQQQLISMQALALDCGSAHVAAPRSLHHQTLRSREILVKERLNMHLVWSDVPQADAPVPPGAEFNGEQMGVCESPAGYLGLAAGCHSIIEAASAPIDESG